MSDKSNRNGIQRIFIIASGLVFLGGMAIMSFPLDNLLGNNKQKTQPTNTTGQAPAEDEKLQQVAKGYEQVLKREPDNVNALQGLAVASLQMQDFQGAIAPLEKLNKIYPDDPKVRQFLAEAYLKTNNLTSALPLIKKQAESYEGVLKQNPNDTDALKGLAIARLQMQDFQGAIAPLEKLYNIYPEDAQVLQYLAEARLRTNNTSGAIPLLEKLAQLNPDNERVKQVLAQVKQQQSQTIPQK